MPRNYELRELNKISRENIGVLKFEWFFRKYFNPLFTAERGGYDL